MNNKIPAILAATLVSGCATMADCDPAIERNVFTKADCQFSGKYGQRQVQLQSKIAEERALADSRAQILALLQEEQRGVSRNLQDLQARYRRLNSTLSSLIAQLQTSQAGNRQMQARIAQLQQKLDNVNNSQSSSSTFKKQATLNALYNEVQNLQQELDYH